MMAIKNPRSGKLENGEEKENHKTENETEEENDSNLS